MESLRLKLSGELFGNVNETVRSKYLKNIFFGGTFNIAIVNEACLLSLK